MNNEKDINDILGKINASEAIIVLKEASDIAIDSASINNREIMIQIERDSKKFRIFKNSKKSEKNP